MGSRTYTFNQFVGGLNLINDSTKLGPNEYPFLSNGRVRFNKLKPTKKPSIFESELPSFTKTQAIYGYGSYLLIFGDGKAYWRDFNSTNQTFYEVNNVALDASVERIFSTAFPASTINYQRKSGTTPDADKVLGLSDIGSPAAALVTDGLVNTQPLVILPDGTARVTKNYSQWMNASNEREYVPTGLTFPQYIGPRLYGAIRDSQGRITKLVRSVSGRPLDFMVVIDTEGNKIEEEAGDAEAVSHSVDFNEITGVGKIPSEGGEFLVSSLTQSTIVQPDLQSTIFGEPTFRDLSLFPTGMMNPYSIGDNNGDTVFIDQTGVRSFNAILQLKNEGRNSEFSAKISKVFGEEGSIIQNANQVCAINFNNYLLFSVNSIYGPVVLVFDTLIGQWVSIDFYRDEGIDYIKQFAEIRTNGIRRLFAISSNKVFEMFAGDTATCRLQVGDFPQPEDKTSEAIQEAYVGLVNINESGQVQCTNYADNKRIQTLHKSITGAQITETLPAAVPFLSEEDEKIKQRSIPFKFSETSRGRKSGVIVEFNFDAELNEVTLESEAQSGSTYREQSLQEQEISTEQTYPFEFAFTADDGATTQGDRESVRRIIRDRNPDFIIHGGDIDYEDDVENNITVPWGKYRDQDRFWAALGNHDIDGDNGKEVIDLLRFPNNSRYYNRGYRNVEVFIYNSGWDTGSVLREPHGNDVNSQQGKWLRTKLAASTARFKIVVMHHPPYTNGIYSPGFPDIRLPFKSWGADIVLSGHAHIYERFYVDSFPYVVCGIGGHSLRALPTTFTQEPEVQFNENYGCLFCKVDRFNMEFRLIDNQGNIQDRFMIQK